MAVSGMQPPGERIRITCLSDLLAGKDVHSDGDLVELVMERREKLFMSRDFAAGVKLT